MCQSPRHLTCQSTVETSAENRGDEMQERSVEAQERENAFLREELAEARARLASIVTWAREAQAVYEAEKVVAGADLELIREGPPSSAR